MKKPTKAVRKTGVEAISIRSATPVESANDAHLAYVSDRQPGISRIPRGKELLYRDSKGRIVREHAILQRIRSLVIPPNWKNVWICSNPKGHLQATGRDARSHKQYRYHPRYRAIREETKFEKMAMFGQMLPRIRRRVEHDLRLPGLPKEKVVATVIRLMDLAHIRVGNEEYARENNSYGLTTMRDRHVKIKGSQIQFQFQGKSGKAHALDLRDRRLAAIVRRCRDLPGYELFQYLDESGNHSGLDSGMVNEYLRETTGRDITAKDFRTWHGTVHAAEQLVACGDASTGKELKHNVAVAIQGVSDLLGNRPATCRKYYVHPAVLEMYAGKKLAQHMMPRGNRSNGRSLSSCELCILDMLLATGRAAAHKIRRSA